MNQDHQSAPSGHRGEQMQQDSVHSALTTSGVPSAVHRAEGGENAPLAAGSDANARDAARYRWLRENADSVNAAGGSVRWTWDQDKYGAPDFTLDAAIDAAMGLAGASGK